MQRLRHARRAISSRAITCALFAAAFLVPSGAAFAAPPAQGKLDTVYRFNARTEKTQTIQGTITADTLDGLKITRDGDKESEYPAAEVIQVIWGDIPAELKDARKLAKRDEYEQAINNFQTAATSDAREPVKAIARLESVRTLLRWGASDRAKLADAIAEADRFISSFSTNRHLPEVRALKARASWLNGDAEAARDGYKALFEAGKDGTAGYPPLAMADAALQGGHAAFAAGDAAGGRALMDMAQAAFRAIETTKASEMAQAAAGIEVASLGEALSKLARGDMNGAKGSLQRAVDSKETDAAKSAAKLALGRVLLSESKHHEAKMAFAGVAALDYTSADRRAAAMIGMAETAVAADPEGGATEAKELLLRVTKSFGHTPAAAIAAKRLESM